METGDDWKGEIVENNGKKQKEEGRGGEERTGGKQEKLMGL